MPRHYTCTCALRPNPHQILRVKRDDHDREYAELIESEKDSARMLQQSFDALRLDDRSDNTTAPETPDELAKRLAELKLSKTADFTTALALTDDGSDIRQQPSKLFTSRAVFQDNQASHNPASFNSLPMVDAHQSVMAVVADALSSSYMPKVKQRSLDVLAEIERQVDAATATLEVDSTYDAENAEHVALLRSTVNAASPVAISAEKSLAHVNPGPDKDAVISKLRALELRINYIGSALPPETTPLVYDTTHITENPIKDLDIIAQVVTLLAIVLHVIAGLATDPTELVIGCCRIIVQLTMSLHTQRAPSAPNTYDAEQQDVLDQLPSSLYTALNKFNIDGKTIQYAICPSCHHAHAPENPNAIVSTYPATCVNPVLDGSGIRICAVELLVERDGRLRPIKPFLCPSFIDHIAQVMSDPEIERICDKACDDALAALNSGSIDTTNVFQATFLKHFEGRVPGKLFVDRGQRLRLAYAIFLDFFNPNGLRKRGNHDSVGILSAVNLALPLELQHKPEYTYVCLIAGPKEPSVEQMNGYLGVIIDDALVAWERGIHLSSTGTSPSHGRDADVAFILAVNDLPTGRKLAGAASHNSHFFCTVCSCYGIPTMYRTDFHHCDWKPRDVEVLRKAAEAWRDAKTLKERNAIFAKHGVRWSEMWRLPYWNPSRMLVIDAMHCILEGLVHYHCRRVLEIDVKVADNAPRPAPAFNYEWAPYIAEKVPKEFRIKTEKELRQITLLRAFLAMPISGETAIAQNKADWVTKVMKRNKPPIQFVCFSLGLPLTEDHTKEDLADLLYTWRLAQPPVSPFFVYRPKTITSEDIEFIQKVIAKTTTPAWVNSVPKKYGDSNAGTIKADEWRILATIYIPIALILLWGDNRSDAYAAHFESLLVHSMAMFQAADLVCRNTTNQQRASIFRAFMKQWVDNLHSLHPHTKFDDKRPNAHIAFHLYDFLLLFGPVMSWWSFPFERLIGMLQKINTNDHPGGELEATILKSWMRGANIRRWIGRSDCPRVFLEFKRLFDKAFTRRNFREEEAFKPGRDRETAHFTYKGRNYSRASTHLGNSLVIYYPPSSSTSTAGSIEKISIINNEVFFCIRRQAPLPQNKFDPFKRFTHFHAQTYSSEMVPGPLEVVHPSSVISHCARFEFSDDRAVILNLSRD